jgi:copper chaperone
VSTITKAVWSVDNGTKVQIDLATRHVQIEPIVADARRLSDAIAEAGYTPVPEVPYALNQSPLRCCSARRLRGSVQTGPGCALPSGASAPAATPAQMAYALPLLVEASWFMAWA